MHRFNLGGVPTLGAILGTSGSDALLSQINTELGSGDFFNSINDVFAKGRQLFVANIVQPIRAIGNTIKNVIGTLLAPDTIIPITREEQLHAIPTAMHLPILTYAPVRKLFDEGRIFGFGLVCIPEDDPYGRLFNNGTCEDVGAAMDKDGFFELVWEFKSDDPELTFEELDSIDETRRYLDDLLVNTNHDFTDYPNERG